MTAIPLPAEKPKAAAKPAVQKSYALLSDIQIAGIKERLKLSAAQEQHWPGVESALRAVARKIHATRQANPAATGAPIDPEWSEVQQLKSVAMPLLVPAARRPEARSPLAGAHHRAGVGRVADLSRYAERESVLDDN